ncbi:hypothetical protein PAQ31011_02791 [Pandoraea aquatica]|uniref:Uncharacterized protein n=1 Tax=Pandoraea aquatica TaxID=2508290 RepID=A0A5E4VMV0_9BURK|nr:hypothetical protein [Pandoraea aquatica]VVE13737.1 hypothetical protein PAQ31011_02791 [Pandoraea aquatica]
MTFGMQFANHAPAMGGFAPLASVALHPGTGPASAAGMSLARIANVPSAAVAHPWTARESQAAGLAQSSRITNQDSARRQLEADFAGVTSQEDRSGETSSGALRHGLVDVDSVDVLEAPMTGEALAAFLAPRVAQAVLPPAALATLHVCAGSHQVSTRIAALDGRNHPVVMPDGRSERAQVCRDIVNGSLLGTDGRNGTVPFEPTRADVTKAVADTARRWTGKPDLAGKKEWSTACLVHETPSKFIGKLNARLQAGTRVVPPSESTEWMLRVGFAAGLPMQQAIVRGDLPALIGLGTDEWAKLALGVEQLGERHWDMRHTEVMDAAAMPATNTAAFTALATSMYSVAKHIAVERLRNYLTQRGVPTMPAAVTSESPLVA